MSANIVFKADIEGAIKLYHKRRGGFSKKAFVLSRIVLLIALMIALLTLLDAQIRPVIITMAQYQCRVASVMAMNNAVMEELQAYPNLNDELAHIDRADDGTVTSIEVNAALLNEIKAKLTAAVMLKLSMLDTQDIYIPFGTLLGWQLLAGRGPNIRLRAMPASFVEASTNDTFTAAGINQTRHSISIRFTVQMSAIMAGYSTSVTVDNEICVAQALIVGKVPQFYAS